MLARLIEFSLTQRLFVFLSAPVLLGAGGVALQRTPVDAFPDVSTTQVEIILRAPGMTPEEVESRITAPIEIEMLGIPRQTTLRSITKYALADVTVDFREGTDVYWARQQVSERLAGLRSILPPGAEGGVAPMTTPLGEIFMFTIEGGRLSLAERRTLLDWVIRPALRSVEGVADVNALGGEVETFEVVRRVRARLEQLEPTLPEGVRVQVFYDRGDLVQRAVAIVQSALGSAVLLVIVVLVVFLADARAALTVALVLPLTVLGTFIWMRLLGLSANLMSLGGLAIATGMLVDPAIVVVENVVSHLGQASATRLPRLHVIYRAVREVSVPVSAGTLIIVLVFLPLLVLEGLEGKLFVPVAITIVCALGTALVLSLSVLPAFASLLIRGSRSAGGPAFLGRLETAYRASLEQVIRFPRPALLASGGLLVAAAILFAQIGRIFLPTLDEGNVIVQLEKLPSIDLQTSLELDLRIERLLRERVPEIASIVARTGADEIGLDPMGSNQTDAFLVLRPRDEWRDPSTDVLLDRIREVLELFPGITYGFTQPIDMRVSEMLTGVRGDVAVKIHGFDLAELERTASAVAPLLETIPGAEDVFRSRTEGAEYLEIDIDPLAAGRLGLSVDDLQQRLRSRLEGVDAGTVFDGARRVPLVLRSAESLRESTIDFRHTQLPSRGSESIPLAAVASIERVRGPVQINREGASRLALVTANVRGRDLVGFVEEARTRVAREIDLPAGFHTDWGGQFENRQRAAARLATVIPIGLGLIFLILFSTFRSMAQAALVLGNIPLALVGGVVGLWISGEYLSVPATIGFVALLGIAVLDGVVLVATFNQLREEGVPIETAVRDGAARRLRPVLMTASSTALGLLPLLAATGPGSELQRPLAAVVIGGLVSSTALTLVLLPMLYRRLCLWQLERSGS